MGFIMEKLGKRNLLLGNKGILSGWRIWEFKLFFFAIWMRGWDGMERIFRVGGGVEI